ncbi:MAG: cytochrome c [Alphaproteobacteria bacterium]
MLPLGKIANDNPWEALHNMLNGHPNAEMPSLRLLGMDVLVDILAYIQTFPSEYLQASIVRGGRLYDSWFDEIKVKPSASRHAYYPDNGYYAKKAISTWRCRECHGWDYKGKDGAYGEGKHFTGIKGINGSVKENQETIFNVLSNPPHNYRNLLDMRDIMDLANFVLKGQVDMDEYIDPKTGKSRGDAQNSAAIYNTYCLHCHGENGKGVGDSLPLGDLARSNPWKALHNIINGHPNEIMPPLRVIGKPVIMDMLAYIQSLGKR